MKIEEKEAVVRRLFPSWLVSLAVLVIGGLVIVMVFHVYPEQCQVPERMAWMTIGFGMLGGYFVSWTSRGPLLREVRRWHRNGEAVKADLERAAADYLALYLLLPHLLLPPDDVEVPSSCWHITWEVRGLSFLAKQVRIAAEQQVVVQQNPKTTREEEEVAQRQYAAAATRFYITRDALIARGSEYAKGLKRWSDALR